LMVYPDRLCASLSGSKSIFLRLRLSCGYSSPL